MWWVLLDCTPPLSVSYFSSTTSHSTLHHPSHKHTLTHSLTHSIHTHLTHTHTHTHTHTQDINDDVKIAEFHRINDTPPEEPPLTQAEIGVELAKVSQMGG